MTAFKGQPDKGPLADDLVLREKMRLRVLLQKGSIPAEDQPFEADPPEDVHFGCGCCLREGRAVRADCFSYTPLPRRPFANSSSRRGTPQATHAFEGRCFGCARFFRGRLVEYDRGRRMLWARFLRETSLRVMES